MNTRDWPIRSKLMALVITPVAALLALWIFATMLAFGPALDLLAARTLLYDLGRPGEALVAELQRERWLSVVQLAGAEELPALREQRLRTDRALTELRRRAGGEPLRAAADNLLDARLDQLVTALDALPAGRGSIDRRQMDRTGALGLFSGMISSAFQAFAAMAALPDEDLNRQARALTGLGQARELLGQTDALLAGALAAGRFAEGEHAQLVQTIGNQRLVAASAVAELPDADRTAYQRLTEGDAFIRLRAMQEDLVAADRAAPPPVDARAWQTSHGTVQQRLRDFELTEADGLVDRSVPVAVGVLVRLAAAGVLGLVAVVVSILVALRVGRSLAERLTGVRADALEMAEHRLPDVVARLRRGEEVDTAREVPPLEYGDDEIGQVGQAFSVVQRTAVRSAVDEAALRRGLNEVFLNIARRSQGLVHRQLALLDRMEHRTEDPDELAELFQVDHLATRMRRHAEDLVILAGAAPGRGWRNPVAVVDLIRGAISEVESYDRVDITAVQPAAAVGRAVGDVIHLLAELIENAASFSPPRTRVEVSGLLVPNGYAVEISDRGLGMAAGAVEEANRRLARAPDFDPAESVRLGLFVVARLAARHHIRVQLRPSAHGGVTAVVLIPSDLVTTETPLECNAEPPKVRRLTSGEQRLTKVTTLVTLPRPAAAQEPSEPAAPVVPLRLGRSVAADEPPDADGLPRRVRRCDPGTRAPEPVVETPSSRAPEVARALMSALQAGTARGRRDSGAGSGPLSAPAGFVPAGSVPAGRPAADHPSTELPRVPPDLAATAEPFTATGRNA